MALYCLEYSDREVAAMLDIAYGTARTHLYNAIYKPGIKKVRVALPAEKLGFQQV